jgi:hypothetical protein
VPASVGRPPVLEYDTDDCFFSVTLPVSLKRVIVERAQRADRTIAEETRLALSAWVERDGEIDRA